jgi:hypothetical protein
VWSLAHPNAHQLMPKNPNDLLALVIRQIMLRDEVFDDWQNFELN